MKRILVGSMVALAGLGGAALTQPNPCAAITDDKSRLQCYDGAATKQKAAGPSAAKEDPFVTAAKSRVRQQLRDPDSARFQDIKIKTVGGVKGLCGQINAKNAAGGMTGFIPWMYDGKTAYVLAFNPGAGNPTTLDAQLLGITLGSRLEAHEKWCK